MRAYKIIRTVIVTMLSLVIAIPLLLYIGLSLPIVQAKICAVAEIELTKVLGTDVEIGSLSIKPFNQVILKDVHIADSAGEQAAIVKKIGAGLSLYDLMSGGNIVINYAELIGLDAYIHRATPDSPLNIQNIIDALNPKDKTKPPTKFDFRINTVVIRQSRVSFDILSAPVTEGCFDKNHIQIEDFRADIHIPKLKNDDFEFEFNQFAMQEQSGLSLENLTGKFKIASTGIKTTGVEISFPNSYIHLADIDLTFDGWENLKRNILSMPIDFGIEEGSYITPSDFAAFSPALYKLDMLLSAQMHLDGTVNDLNISKLEFIDLYRDITVDITGNVKHLADSLDVVVDFPHIEVSSNGDDIMTVLTSYANLSPSALKTMSRLGNIGFKGDLSGDINDVAFVGNVSTSAGSADIHMVYDRLKNSNLSRLNGSISTHGIDLKRITANDNLGSVAGNISLDATLGRNYKKGRLNAEIIDFSFKNYEYDNLMATLQFDNDDYLGEVVANDPNMTFNISGNASFNDTLPVVNVGVEIVTLNLDSLNLWNKYPGYTLSAKIDANFTGGALDDADGVVSVEDVVFTNNEKNFNINSILVSSNGRKDQMQSLTLSSDFIDGHIEGAYSFATLVPAAKQILSTAFPVFSLEEEQITRLENSRINDFSYNFILKSNSNFSEFFNLPISFGQDVVLSGAFSQPNQNISLELRADEIIQNNKDKSKIKKITGSLISTSINGEDGRLGLYVQSVLPTKRGPMTFAIRGVGEDNTFDTQLAWNIKRQGTFKGNVEFTTTLSRNIFDDNSMIVDVDFDPHSKMIFNDTVWMIAPSTIHYADSVISVDGLRVYRDNQYVLIDGQVSRNPNDRLMLDIYDFNLDYIFETLEIENAMLGGDATGTIYASNLLSHELQLVTKDVLKVKNISYNRTVLGNADIKSWWDIEQKAVMLDAVVSQENGRTSTITGSIKPLDQYLDLTFNADLIKVGFMQQFMKAFASDVSGYASGKARLYGTFKDINMEGNIFARNLGLKINFTNVHYQTLEGKDFPIVLTPGRIDIKGITITDKFGNTAQLNGVLTHDYFRAPVFDFEVTNADELLSYDVTPSLSPDWYGRVFGYGGARVSGKPGVVNIGVSMETAPNSSFTFVLSDREDAVEHSFITFRDPNRQYDVDIAVENTPSAPQSSNYIMTIDVALENNPEVIVIMDPVGGDSIRSNGRGNIRMFYDAENNDLSLHGGYEIDRGNYNFTLQDIILKNFTIISNPDDNTQKSQILFNGDPYATKLNLWASYDLYANISDLDASFQESGNTNVPTQAVIHINGEMLKPNTSYTIKFPKMENKPDIVERLNTIIGLRSGNQEMIQQQVIYLLALNRFYTPEYMASTTKGNELFSVASSTISSQLSSMLGNLSENWNISPMLRSDQGDFSDVEVDVALSSRLLNNRLLFNGNFGYRDNSLNTNQFVGDFDIEYLLTPSGTWRLKAYNRYNDQNYYYKTAETTQGVGIVLKRDFDNIFSFLKPLKTKKDENSVVPGNTEDETQSENVAIPTDTIKTTSNDILFFK